MGRETEILRSSSSREDKGGAGGEERTERGTEPRLTSNSKLQLFLLQLKLIVITIIVIVI